MSIYNFHEICEKLSTTQSQYGKARIEGVHLGFALMVEPLFRSSIAQDDNLCPFGRTRPFPKPVMFHLVSSLYGWSGTFNSDPVKSTHLPTCVCETKPRKTSFRVFASQTYNGEKSHEILMKFFYHYLAMERRYVHALV